MPELVESSLEESLQVSAGSLEQALSPAEFRGLVDTFGKREP